MLTDDLINKLQELSNSAEFSPAVESAIHNLMLDAYHEGHHNGYVEGFDAGY